MDENYDDTELVDSSSQIRLARNIIYITASMTHPNDRAYIDEVSNCAISELERNLSNGRVKSVMMENACNQYIDGITSGSIAGRLFLYS